MKKLFVMSALAVSFFIYSCGGGDQSSGNTPEGANDEIAASTSGGNTSYDTSKGEGKFKNVEISPTLDQAMSAKGETVYNVKCGSCHKLSDERLVGPGWKGVTQRHKPEWIMNFITNPDEMLSKDPKAQAQLEVCLVRMPNQNVADEDARGLYEFMRKNDGVK